MRGISGVQQARALNVAAKMHEELGNTLLASWLRASAVHAEEVDKRTRKALDEMPLGVYVEERHSVRMEFTKDWYAYEGEYAYNFNGLE